MADQKKLVQLALIAGGGYLLWQMFGPKDRAAEPSGGGVQPSGTPVTTRVPEEETSTPAPQAPPTQTIQQPAVTPLAGEDRLRRAATSAGWAAEAAGTLMTVDQWNYYRSRYQKDVISNPDWQDPRYLPALDAFIDPGQRFAAISAAQYHELLSRAGLEGLFSGLRPRTWHNSGGVFY